MHVWTNAHSPHFVKAIFEHDVGIRFNNKDLNDAQECCISANYHENRIYEIRFS